MIGVLVPLRRGSLRQSGLALVARLRRWIVLALLVGGLVPCQAESGRSQPDAASSAELADRSGGAPSTTDERIAFYRSHLGGRGSYPVHARLGLALLERHRETGREADLRDAERYLRRSQDWQPNYEAMIGLASIAAARHRFDEAATLAEAAELALPGSSEARGILFEVHLARGDIKSANEIVVSMFATGRTFASLGRLAAFREYQGALRGALAAIDEACATEGGTASRDAWCGVRRGALTLLAHCDDVAAEKAYQIALDHVPNYWFAREHLAELRAAQGREVEAREIYERLLADLPEPRYRLALAALQESAGLARQARRQRSRALTELRDSVDGGSPEHELEYVLALLAEGDAVSTATALEVARRAARERQDWLTLDALAQACLAAGSANEAVQIYDDALRSGSRNPGLLLNAAVAFDAVGRRDEARRFAEEALACPLAIEPGDRVIAERLGSEAR